MNNNETLEAFAIAIIELGEKALEAGLMQNNKNLITAGNTVRLIGGVCTNDAHLEEFNNLVQSFSAKQILSETSPKEIILAKTVTRVSELNPETSMLLTKLLSMVHKDMGLANEDLLNFPTSKSCCSDGSSCTDKNCCTDKNSDGKSSCDCSTCERYSKCRKKSKKKRPGDE